MSDLAPVAGSVALSELQPGDEALIVAVLEEPTYEKAGERVGVSERTVQRRLAEPGFRSAVTALAYQRLEAAAWRLFMDAPGSAETLRDLRGEAAAEPGASVRLKAAVANLDFMLRVAAALTARQLEPRLAAVEETVAEAVDELRRMRERSDR